MPIEVKTSTDVDNENEDVVVDPVDTTTDTTETTEESQHTEVEQRAMEQGWNPDFDGPNKRSAREFLDRGELLDRISAQSRELKQVSAIVTQLSDQNRQVYKAGYERALKELRASKAKAVDSQDGNAVVQIDEAIDNTKEALRKIDNAPASQQTVQETGAFTDFKDSNPWYNQSEEMRHFAHGIGLAYANKNPQASEEQVYEHIVKVYNKTFPTSNRGGRELPSSPDGTSRKTQQGGKGGSGGKAAFDKIIAGMPEDQARVAKDMVRRGIITAEKYAEDYNAVVQGR